jgi:uncharacterized Zn-finger protein
MSQDKSVIKEKTVTCDGGNTELGHPKIYLEIKDGSDCVECPYCGHKFYYLLNN